MFFLNVKDDLLSTTYICNRTLYTIHINLLESLLFYNANYETIVEYKYTPYSGDQYLGDKENRVCRFCGKNSFQTKFSDDPKNAHAIPQLLGNNQIFSYYECISCNDFFKKYERDLGAFTHPLRVAFEIPGKKGYPHINDTHIWDSVNRLYIRKEMKRKSGLDEEKKEFTQRDQIPPYIPINVTKAFVKIAMTLLPEKYINLFQSTLKWLMSDSNEQLLSVQWGITFTPGKICANINFALIIGRHDIENNVSDMFFIISIRNLMLQIPLELDKDDQHETNNLMNLPIYPLHFIKIEDFYGLGHQHFVNFNKQITWNPTMSGDEKIKGEPFWMKNKTGKIIKLTIEDIQELL